MHGNNPEIQPGPGIPQPACSLHPISPTTPQAGTRRDTGQDRKSAMPGKPLQADRYSRPMTSGRLFLIRAARE